MSSVRKVSTVAYSFKPVQTQSKNYSDLLKATERLDGIGNALNPELWEKAYKETLEFIKKHEGWNNGHAYYDVCGIKTIGYGHVITKHDKLPAKITQAQADSLLKLDFNKALRACDRVTSLRGNKRLAIAHFIFAKGIGSFNRSKVKEKVLTGENIENEILEWCTYRAKNGKTHRSEYSYNIRKWEAQMYNR